MKYILILLTTMLFSCHYSYIENGKSVVVKITTINATLSKYQVSSFHEENNNDCVDKIKFIANSHLYNVGDTVWFTKK